MTTLRQPTRTLSQAQVLELIAEALDDFLLHKKWGTVNVRVEVCNGDIKEVGLSPEQTYRAVKHRQN